MIREIENIFRLFYSGKVAWESSFRKAIPLGILAKRAELVRMK